jgi:hypothetical protein
MVAAAARRTLTPRERETEMSGTGNALAALVASLLALGGIGCGHASAGEAPTTSAAKASRSASPCRQRMPSADIEARNGTELELELHATGVQIYTCTASPAGAAWTFQAPEATLYRRGNVAGKHYAGPTWQALDGSTVVGAKVAQASPDPAAIPWLLLRAASHGGGHGRFSEVTHIQRVDTRGGLSPASGCDASTLGAVARVPYTATYCFLEDEG